MGKEKSKKTYDDSKEVVMERKSEVLEWVDRTDLLMLMTVICHLMSCYGVRLCPAIAAKVEAHLRGRAGDRMITFSVTSRGKH